MAMDTIVIRDLEVDYRVGVPDTERAKPQRLLLSLEMAHDIATAAAKDDLRWSIDYHAVVQRLSRWGEERSWALIETLAVEIAELILSEFGAASVTVEVKKFILPQTRYVSVRVTRAR